MLCRLAIFVTLFVFGVTVFAAEVPSSFMSDVGAERREAREILVKQGPVALKPVLKFAVNFPTNDSLHYRMLTQVNVVVRDIIFSQMENSSGAAPQNLQALIDDVSFNFIVKSLSATDAPTRQVVAQTLILLKDPRTLEALKSKAKLEQNSDTRNLISAILSRFQVE